MSDLSAIYADLAVIGLAKSALYGAQSANVTMDQADIELFGGTMQSRDYQMRYESASLVGLKRGDSITVDGALYTVREVAQVSDGLECVALLSKS